MLIRALEIHLTNQFSAAFVESALNLMARIGLWAVAHAVAGHVPEKPFHGQMTLRGVLITTTSA